MVVCCVWCGARGVPAVPQQLPSPLQNPAREREREELFKIQQERERELWTGSSEEQHDDNEEEEHDMQLN